MTNKTASTVEAKFVSNRVRTWMLFGCLIFFKIFGLATFSFNPLEVCKRNGAPLEFIHSRLGIAYNVVLIVLVGLSNFISVPYRLDLEYPNKTNLSTTIELLQTVLGSISLGIIFIAFARGQRSLIKLGNKSLEVDWYFRSVNGALIDRRESGVPILACLTNGFLHVGLLISEFYAFPTDPRSWLTDIIPTFLIGWLIVQYFIVVTLMNARFIEVNRAIENLSRSNLPEIEINTATQCRRVFVSSSTLYHFVKLRDIHGYLCDACNEISDFYSIPTLPGITFYFFTLLYNAYYLITPFLVTENEPIILSITINTIFWIIVLIYPLSLVTSRNTIITKEFDRTGIIVHQLLTLSISEDVKKELKMFSMQLLHRKIQFSACGLFVLDCRLLHMIIGAVSTYLVILIQFEMGNSSQFVVHCNCTR